MRGNNSPFSAGHADNRSISGTVQDTQNNGLNDVQVELADANGAMVTSTYTNPSGHFEFTRRCTRNIHSGCHFRPAAGF